MLLVLSPAKSLELNKPIECSLATQPVFDNFKKPIVKVLKKLTTDELATTFSLSEKLALLNYERNQALGTKTNLAQTRQAMFTFDGEVYSGFDMYSLNKKWFTSAQDTVRILSGLYGVLKPFDMIEPYRLEMGSKISVGKTSNLYQFWSQKVTQLLNQELTPHSHLLNLASNEYFKVIDLKSLIKPIINFEFLELDNGELKNISFFSKRARGLMARFIVEHNIKKTKDLVSFDSERYEYNDKLSHEAKLVFTRTFQPIGKK